MQIYLYLCKSKNNLPFIPFNRISMKISMIHIIFINFLTFIDQIQKQIIEVKFFIVLCVKYFLLDLKFIYR